MFSFLVVINQTLVVINYLVKFEWPRLTKQVLELFSTTLLCSMSMSVSLAILDPKV